MMVKSRTSYNRTGYVAMVLIATLFISSCGSNDSSQYETGPQDVDFVVLKESNAATKNTYPGMLEGSVNVDVKAQVGGYLDGIFVKEGDYVKKGQSLFQIKADLYNEQVKNSEAAFKAALSAQEVSKLEVEKLRPLVEAAVVSDMQLKTAEANYAATRAQVAQAKAALETTRINSAFTLIKAPVSGYIGRIPNRIGNLVTSSDATPLTTLSEIDNIYVYFSMSEADYIAYSRSLQQQGEKLGNIELLLADGSIYNQKGKIELASGNIDRTTGSMVLKAIFPNPEKLLRAGGSGRVIINKTLDKIIVIPKTCVRDIQDQHYIFKLADSNKVFMIPVEFSGGNTQTYFVKSGAKPGDKIAINRIDLLQDQIAVKPKLTSLDSVISK